MMPASSNRAGWSLFQREMRNFFTGAKPVSMAEASSKNGGGGGDQSTSGDRSGKLLSTYGHQQKFRNFENFGAILGQNGIPGVLTVNGSVLNGKVSVINGRPTRDFTFKLTPGFFALRVCRPEGGKRSIICMGTKDFNWPKVLSGKPELINQSGGLVKAHPIETVSSPKSNLVKPVSLKESYNGQSTWVQGESLRGRSRLVSESSMSIVAPMSATEVFGSSMITVAPASVMKGSNFGFSGMEVTNWRLREET